MVLTDCGNDPFRVEYVYRRDRVDVVVRRSTTTGETREVTPIWVTADNSSRYRSDEPPQKEPLFVETPRPRPWVAPPPRARYAGELPVQRPAPAARVALLPKHRARSNLR